MHEQTNDQHKTPASDERLLVTIAECRRMLSCSITTTYDLLRAGDLDGRRVGKRTLITMASIVAYIARLPDAGLRRDGDRQPKKFPRFG
jgi:hypothetical protein